MESPESPESPKSSTCQAATWLPIGSGHAANSRHTFSIPGSFWKVPKTNRNSPQPDSTAAGPEWSVKSHQDRNADDLVHQ
jgi:hypothetical protein